MTEYNGWTNRETWAFMLHMQNDEGLYAMLMDSVEELQGEGVDALASRLESLGHELFTGDGYRDTFGDVWGEGLQRCAEDIGSLWRVNWDECAESLLEDVNA